jgi:hypothetical protein
MPSTQKTQYEEDPTPTYQPDIPEDLAGTQLENYSQNPTQLRRYLILTI